MVFVTLREKKKAKKKHVTAVIGVEKFGVKLKDAASQLGRALGSGGTVTDSPKGTPEVQVQGDLVARIPAILRDVLEVCDRCLSRSSLALPQPFNACTLLSPAFRRSQQTRSSLWKASEPGQRLRDRVQPIQSRLSVTRNRMDPNYKSLSLRSRSRLEVRRELRQRPSLQGALSHLGEVHRCLHIQQSSLQAEEGCERSQNVH